MRFLVLPVTESSHLFLVPCRSRSTTRYASFIETHAKCDRNTYFRTCSSDQQIGQPQMQCAELRQGMEVHCMGFFRSSSLCRTAKTNPPFNVTISLHTESPFVLVVHVPSRSRAIHLPCWPRHCRVLFVHCVRYVTLPAVHRRVSTSTSCFNVGRRTATRNQRTTSAVHVPASVVSTLGNER